MKRRADAQTLELLAHKEEMDAIWSKDCWRWFCQMVQTVDEAAVSNETGNVFRWPAHYTYLREVLKVLENEPLVIIPKSRRMMISWLVAAYFVWHARYHENGALFWQSETEQKAAFIVDQRCKFIEEHLYRPEFKEQIKTIKTKQGLVGRITYPNGSYIWAVAQGGDVLRTYTATKVMMDECEFQDESPDALTALLPLVEKGAQAILVSSSNGPIGVMAELCRDVGFTSWKDMSTLCNALEGGADATDSLRISQPTKSTVGLSGAAG
jgi:hypothetical protein